MAQGERTARVAERIQRETARLLIEEMDDPVVRGITVTRVEVSRDLRFARVFYVAPAASSPSDPDDLDRRVRRACPALQRALAGRLGLRYAVEIRLQHDQGLDHALRLEGLFREIESTRPHGAGTDPDDAGGATEGDEP